MLIDRQKAKFWQRIVFGVMAFLMVAWLVPMLGMRACSDSENKSQMDELTVQIDELEADLAAAPTDGDIARDLADAYAQRGSLYTDDDLDKRTDDLERAFALYQQYLDSKQAAATTRAVRRTAIDAMIIVSRGLDDPLGALAGYNRIVAEEPKVAGNWIDLALAAEAAGKPAAAVLAYRRALELEPKSPDAEAIRAKIKELKAQAALPVQSTPLPSPAPGE